MEEVTFRFVPWTLADGPHNMAADEALLDAAAEHGTRSLRFYGWSAPTVSLGYFQPAAERLFNPRLASLPWVRRPSGGKTLVHHHELTYCLAVPRGFDPSWMTRMHRQVILPVLSALGSVQVVERETRVTGSPLCFLQHTPGDLTSGVSKVTGSAQRKHRQCLMQHGAILLARSETTPELPGLKETTGVDVSREALEALLLARFERETGWRAIPAPWNAAEQDRIDALAIGKYAAPEWNEKR